MQTFSARFSVTILDVATFQDKSRARVHKKSSLPSGKFLCAEVRGLQPTPSSIVLFSVVQTSLSGTGSFPFTSHIGTSVSAPSL